MAKQKLFRYSFVDSLRKELAGKKGIDRYLSKKFEYSEEDVLINWDMEEPVGLKLKMPEGEEKYDFENAKRIYEAYRPMDRTTATDTRLWTYLSHVTFWDYMRKRNSIESQLEEKRGKYILEHWFLNGLSPNTVFRHGIAMLWWGAFLTYDEKNGSDPYALTKELFSMLDYTRTIFTSMQGRNNHFTRALLRYVVANPKLFSSDKETKVRILAKLMNRKGGHMLLPTLSESELVKIFTGYEGILRRVTGRESLSQ